MKHLIIYASLPPVAPIEKKCDATEIDYCAVCSNVPGEKCSKCLPGFIKSDSNGTSCLKCPARCRKCAVDSSTDSGTTCLRCIRRFAWNYADDVCEVAFG